jgi:hypothetical protein
MLHCYIGLVFCGVCAFRIFADHKWTDAPKRPLGLLLTRETANLLSNANPLDINDSLWRTELGDRAIYVDVPHGAILMEGGGSGDDVIELRAILAAPFLPPNSTGQTLFVAQ